MDLVEIEWIYRQTLEKTILFPAFGKMTFFRTSRYILDILVMLS